MTASCHCLGFLSTAVRKHWPKQHGEKGLSGLQVTIYHRNQARLQAEAEEGPMKEWCSLVCSACFLNTTQDCLPSGAMAHSGLSLPMSIINQENAYKRAHGPIWWRKILQLRFLSLQVTLVCVRLTKKQTQHHHEPLVIYLVTGTVRETGSPHWLTYVCGRTLTLSDA